MITLIILTYNESKHIRRCVLSAKNICEDIYIVDSGSTDDTLMIAEELGCVCFKHEWQGNQADQFNWALDNLPIKTEWIMRLDADEYLLPELADEIKEKVGYANEIVNGFYLRRRVYFMDKWIRYGGYYPFYLLRLWRYGFGRYEPRLMDEHIKIKEGITVKLENDFVDHNLNNIEWWIEKHNNYSTREAAEALLCRETNKKRLAYYKLPRFIRPFTYFFYRYFIRLGFLDGKEGLIFHSLQGLLYRFLVDAKIYDIEDKQFKDSLMEIIKDYQSF